MELGKQQKEAFQRKLPEGFYEPISKIVKTFKYTLKKNVVIEGAKLYNAEAIYARTMGLRNSDRDIGTETLLML